MYRIAPKVLLPERGYERHDKPELVEPMNALVKGAYGQLLNYLLKHKTSLNPFAWKQTVTQSLKAISALRRAHR